MNLPPIDTPDIYERLASVKQPLLMYGTGDGADKIAERLAKYGISVAGYFASDGFVRDRQFCGKKVLSLSDAESNFGEFTVILAFGSSLPPVIENIKQIASRHNLFCPDIPVAESPDFTSRFYRENYESICECYSLFADEKSRQVFAELISFRLDGDINHVFACQSEKSEVYSLINSDTIKTAIDAGAYNGDTCRELLKYSKSAETIYAIEPDSRNFKKLSDCSTSETRAKIIPINAAVGDKEGEIEITDKSGRGTKAGGEKTVKLMTIDSLGIRPDYIKYDVEGFEAAALSGSENIIKSFSPRLCVSAYHKSGDIFTIPLYLKKLRPDCRIYIRKAPGLPGWDINIIAV
jgi:FkbM family methyltransferase